MLSKLKKKSGDKGFTLIELVLVVVILGILTAVAIPAFGKLIDTTRANVTEAAATSFYSGALVATMQGGDVADAVPGAVQSPTAPGVYIRTTDDVTIAVKMDGNRVQVLAWYDPENLIPYGTVKSNAQYWFEKGGTWIE